MSFVDSSEIFSSYFWFYYYISFIAHRVKSGILTKFIFFRSTAMGLRIFVIIPVPTVRLFSRIVNA